MSFYLDVDKQEIIKLGQYVDQYESDIRSLQQTLNENFERLKTENKWGDTNYQLYKETEVDVLNEEVQFIYNHMENEVRPFLAEIYRRLSDLQDSW